MRSKKLRLVISILTFSLGLGVFYLWHLGMLMLQEQKKEIVAESVQSDKKDLLEDFDPWKLSEGAQPLEKGEFFLVGHGCGNGYTDGWLAYDGSRLSEGFNRVDRKDFNEIIKSSTILQRVENYPNKNGEKGLRIVLKGINEKTGGDYYSILWVDKWQKKEAGMYYIDAPNLEIALELEQKLIKDSQRK